MISSIVHIYSYLIPDNTVVAVAFIRRDGDDGGDNNDHQLKGSVHKRMQMFSNYMADMDGRSIDSSSVDNDLEEVIFQKKTGQCQL